MATKEQIDELIKIYVPKYQRNREGFRRRLYSLLITEPETATTAEPVITTESFHQPKGFIHNEAEDS